MPLPLRHGVTTGPSVPPRLAPVFAVAGLGSSLRVTSRSVRAALGDGDADAAAPRRALLARARAVDRRGVLLLTRATDIWFATLAGDDENDFEAARTLNYLLRDEGVQPMAERPCTGGSGDPTRSRTFSEEGSVSADAEALPSAEEGSWMISAAAITRAA